MLRVMGPQGQGGSGGRQAHGVRGSVCPQPLRARVYARSSLAAVTARGAKVGGATGGEAAA
eukprot:5214908-Pleurochrysis_carterae.AAC.3